MSGDPAGLTEAGVRWAAIIVFAAVTAVGVIPLNPSGPAAVAGAVVAVGAAVPLVLRWRPALLYAAVATAGIAVLGNGRSSNIGWFAVCLLTGWCVLAASRREGLLYWAALMVLFTVEWLGVSSDPGWGAWLAGATLTAVFSLLIRRDRDLLGQLRQAQAGLAEQARTQERNRIARDLHDVIGHTLTVSLLHVQSARLAVQHDPADAKRALAEAERLGRACLAEVRTTVGMLREDDAGGPGTGPLPGAGALPALVEQFRSAGADVTLTVEGDVARLPATTGLAAYRIVQEALTNAVKHAPGSPTEVRLAVCPGDVTLTADSRVTPGPASGHGIGHGIGLGLVGMRERAESLGGSCEAGPGGRGWLVRATLPLTGGTLTGGTS
ncbi:MAG TPA: histidine kinase [Streptosporangiaceae bacterium]|nr:histidine kinase [Streptosporangiaceae bacterium]